MKTMKKVLCILLVVLMCMTSAPLGGFVGLELPKANAFVASTGQCGDNAHWEFNSSTGELVISGEGEMWYNHFMYNSPFYSSSDIKKVVIGDNITKIGQFTFASCSNLKTVILGENLEIIDGFAFYYCSKLTDIALPENLTTIGDSVFLGCSSLSEIIIPEKTTEIGYEVFGNCTNLSSIVLPKTLTKIGSDAFYGTPYHTNTENWDNGLLYMDSYLVDANVNELGESCVIKEGTTLIADDTFRYAEITSITLPESVRYIGEEAFYSSYLEEIYIPKAVESIGEQALKGKITVSSENNYFSSDSNGVLFDKDKSTLITGFRLTSYTIPESVTVICNFALSSSTLTDISLPENLTTIGEYAFSGANIKSISIPSKVTSIGDGAFSGCESLESIVIPDSVTYLGANAFSSCDNLVNAEIGKGVTVLKRQLFDRCNNLSIVTIPDTVTEIEFMAFDWCTSLKNITLPSNLKTIGGYAFEGTDLREITIPASVESMGDHVFCYCDNLTDIVIKSEYIDLETYAICEECAYKDDENNWDDGAFYIGKILLDVKTIPETFEIKDGTTCLAKDIFRVYDYDLNYNESENLKTVYIPSSLKIISYSAFNSCKNLTDVYYDGTQAEWNKVEIRDLNNPLLKATIHFNDGTSQSHILHNFDTLSWHYYCYYFYKCACGETTTIFKHVDKNNDKKCDYCDADMAEHACEYEAKVTKEATCTEKGEITYTCSCGESYTEEIPIADHSYTETNRIEPTCTKSGSITYTCTCGDSYTEVLSENGHTDKNTDKLCDVCGENLDVHTHTLIEMTIPATCTMPGAKYLLCTECGEGYDTEAIPATGHNYKITARIEATCIEDGSITYTCVCNDTYTETISAKGHTLSEWETLLEPTYESDGKKVRKCAACGVILEEESIPKLELESVFDDTTGVGFEYPADKYDGEVGIIVEEVFDGSAFNIVERTNPHKSMVFDIKLTVSGKETQPNGKITVKIPLPSDYNPKVTSVIYINLETGKPETMNATYEDGYMVFETDHFSYYAVIAEPDTDNCSCNCHKGGIAGFFFKFILFFQKIFKANQECKCGIAHY